MAGEQLGLFDTPAGGREAKLAGLIIGVLAAALFFILPVQDRFAGEIPPFVPVIDAVIAGGELIIATLLFAQASIFRSRALLLLASGFVFIALLLAAHAITFPGAFSRDGLLGGGTNATAWVMIFRRVAFPVIVILYVCLRRTETRDGLQGSEPSLSIGRWVLGSIASAALATLIAVRGNHFLPPIFIDRATANSTNLMIFNLVDLALLAAAAVALLVKRKSMLDAWLLVSLAGWIVQMLLNIPLHARFTVGWYALFLVVLVSHMAFLLALIGESNRLYARLALANAARNREREARLLSVDVMAASFSHEMGQPLSAISTSATAALKWLDRGIPDAEKAIEALQNALEASERAMAVTRSLRSLASRQPGAISEFSVNDLACQTTSLLQGEMAAERTSLDLELDRSVPEVRADRVQIQQVLINLLVNALESLRETRGRPRRIAIRSACEGNFVRLDVTDTGIGVVPGQVERIFDPFVTTKKRGSGLGLAICRSIVEDHGGRLWATAAPHEGATFHLQLPTRPGAPARVAP